MFQTTNQYNSEADFWAADFTMGTSSPNGYPWICFGRKVQRIDKNDVIQTCSLVVNPEEMRKATGTMCLTLQRNLCFIYPSLSLSIDIFTTYLPTYRPTNQYLSVSISTSISINKYVSFYLSTYLPIYLSTDVPVQSTYLPIYLSSLPIYLSIYLSSTYRQVGVYIIYINIHKFTYGCMDVWMYVCKHACATRKNMEFIQYHRHTHYLYDTHAYLHNKCIVKLI